MVDVRSVTRDGAEDFYRAVTAAFFSVATDDEVQAWLPHLPYGRMSAAYDGSAVVSTLASLPLDVTLPGGTAVDVAGVTMVTTRPMHRRQGLVGRTMRAELRSALGRGEAMAALVASEYPIYRRFGFGPATEHTLLEVDTGLARFVESGLEASAGHSVEEVSGPSLRALAPDLYERQRHRFPGGVRRDPWRWDSELGAGTRVKHLSPVAFHVLCRDPAGDAAGFARFDVAERWDARVPRNIVKLREMVAATPEAEARLWQHLLELDLIGTVQAQERRVAETLPWLLEDARAVNVTWRRDLLWLRPLDVPAVLAARRYGADGDVVVRVVDPLGLADGDVRLVVESGVGVSERTSQEPDLVLRPEAFGPLVMGGRALGDLVAAGWARVADSAVLPRLDALFGWPDVPWCTSWF